MPVASGRLRRLLIAKLGFQEDRSADHPVFERWHQGQLVAITHLSHGRGEVSEGVLGAMARQVGVSGPEFRAAVSCAMSGDELLVRMLSA